MRITKLLLFLSATTFLFGANLNATQTDEEIIPIYESNDPSIPTPPKAPGQIPIECVYISSASTIVVNYLYDLGSVTVEIENQTTGEYGQTVVNALAGPMPFIISGTSGHWRITFTLSSGVCYNGEFDI